MVTNDECDLSDVIVTFKFIIDRPPTQLIAVHSTIDHHNLIVAA